MARGAKKPVSKFSSCSRLFTHGYFLFHMGGGMGTLQQGELIEGFRTVHEDIILLSYVTYMSELLERCVEEKQPNLPLYNFFLKIVQCLSEQHDPDVLLQIYEVKMLSQLGISPELSRCNHCGTSEGLFSFSLQEGGLLCQHCQHLDQYAVAVSSTVSKLLRLYQMIDINRLGTISVTAETKKEIRILLDLYYDRNAGLHLKSKRFLQQIDEMQALIQLPNKNKE